MNLPQKFKENMQRLLGDEYDKYILSLSEPAKRAVRVNFMPKNFQDLFPLEVEPIKGLDNCYSVVDSKIGLTLAHDLGLVYSQEPSSMLAAEALDVKEGERVLDLCSAPGGKASQILSKNKTGVVVLNEYVRSRANILMSNIERQGFKNAIITSTSPEKLAAVFEGYFDKILVDAPCSGEGMFRKDPETVTEWNDGINDFNAARQREILSAAEKMLKVGGTIVYSTCTFSPKEDEESVKFLLDSGRFKICELPNNIKGYARKGLISFGKEYALLGRVYPIDGFGEGQFVAKLTKIAPEDDVFCTKTNKNQYQIGKNDLKNAKMLLKECVNAENLQLYRVKDAIFAYDGEATFAPDVVMLGVRVASVAGKRLVPEHQFFRCYGNDFVQKMNLDIGDSRLEKYLHGEEIETEFQSGYVAVLVQGFCLGGGKAVCGRLKNYYPKGLRR